LRSQIKELFLSFVQKSDPVIERFRFVADYDIDKKLKENTKLSEEEVKEMRSFKINLMDVYLIIESDEKFWVWKQGSQLFDRLLFDVSKYLARE
jgi:tmRNA-binding protein